MTKPTPVPRSPDERRPQQTSASPQRQQEPHRGPAQAPERDAEDERPEPDGSEEKPGPVGPEEDPEAECPMCADPDDVLKALKADLKQQQQKVQEQQGALQDTQQGSTGLDANIKQLEKLAASIKQAGQKYKQGYDNLVEQKGDASCYHTAKGYTVECALEDAVREQIDTIVSEVDGEICEAKQGIDTLQTDLEDKQKAYDEAVRCVTEAEAKLARWIGVEKWIAALLKELDELAQKIEAAEDECEFCRMYVYVRDYENVLKGKESDGWQEECDEPGVCDILKQPDELLTFLWELWCEVKCCKEARTAAATSRDAAKRALEQEIQRHTTLAAARDQTVLDRIAAEIAECAEDADESESESATTVV